MEIIADTHVIRMGTRFAVSFQRTLRIPDNGRTYPLPPGLGAFPIYDASCFKALLPENGAPVEMSDHPPDDNKRSVFFIPMYQREALWLGFRGASWHPNAVMISTGGINAVSGQVEAPVSGKIILKTHPQNYIVTPLQPWLDGFNTGEGTIRQFVAMPLGMGYTMEAAITGRERYGCIHITVFEPRPGRFPDKPPPEISPEKRPLAGMDAAPWFRMGVGAGGVMRQKIYPDPYGPAVWDPENHGEVTIHIVNSAQFRKITGKNPPPTPVDTASYIRHKLPWFELYDEDKADLAAAPPLAEAETIREHDAERSKTDETVTSKIPREHIKKLNGRNAGTKSVNGRRKKQEPQS